MFASSAMLVSVARRKLILDGIWDLDHSIDAGNGYIKLMTADKDSVKKGSWSTVELVTKIKTYDRVLFVEVHEDLIRNGVVTGTSIVAPGDSGTIVFHIKPNRDLDLSGLPYIARVFVER